MPDVFIENEQAPDLSDVEQAARELDPARRQALSDYASLLLSEQEADQ